MQINNEFIIPISEVNKLFKRNNQNLVEKELEKTIEKIELAIFECNSIILKSNLEQIKEGLTNNLNAILKEKLEKSIGNVENAKKDIAYHLELTTKRIINALEDQSFSFSSELNNKNMNVRYLGEKLFISVKYNEMELLRLVLLPNSDRDFSLKNADIEYCYTVSKGLEKVCNLNKGHFINLFSKLDLKNLYKMAFFLRNIDSTNTDKQKNQFKRAFTKKKWNGAYQETEKFSSFEDLYESISNFKDMEDLKSDGAINILSKKDIENSYFSIK